MTVPQKRPPKRSTHSYDVLIPTIRKPGSEIWVTFNPDLEEDDAWQRLVIWPLTDAIVQKVNWNDNPWLAEELRREKDHLKARDLDAYENVWEGRCRSHVAGALWTKEIFEANREPTPETEAEREALLATLKRVVISVDPSGCSSEEDKRADEIGIVATGVGHDGVARVLEDATGHYAPRGGHKRKREGDKRVVYALEDIPVPSTWRKNALLRNCPPLTFDADDCCPVGKRRLRLCPDIGMRVEEDPS